SQREDGTSGTAIAVLLEGLRPMLIEVQALVSNSAHGTPQRSSTGFATSRRNMLLAVLEKRFGFRLSTQDVSLNIAGGLRVEHPASDLAVNAAVISPLQDIAVPATVACAGEVGLSGEIRAVNRIEQRIAEAEKLGFEIIYLAKYNAKGLDRSKYNIDIKAVARVEEVFQAVFGDRKSTRLNSSHVKISYAVFCLKRKHQTLLQV